MALMILIFGISMWFTSRRVQSSTWASIRLRFKNRNLVDSLSGAVETTQAMNENLKLEVAVRRNTEEELQKHRDLLEDKVTQRTEDLSRANEEMSHGAGPGLSSISLPRSLALVAQEGHERTGVPSAGGKTVLPSA